MSGDPRDYYASTRSDDRDLPPLREIVGDALDRTPLSPYSFDFQDVNHSLPGSSKSYGRYQSPGAYYPQRGPTLPPIRRLASSRSHSSHSSHHTQSPSAEPLHHEPRRSRPDASAGYQSVTRPQPATGPAPYSFNVLRAQQGDLVDVRTPSSRAQGILRPTAIIDDEDESHKRYKCDWPGCEKKYDRPSSLDVHRHTHTGQQPYPCLHPGCPRAFNVKSNMLRHFRSHPKPKTPQASGKQEDQESDSEGEGDEDEKWPADTSTVGYFHTAPPSSYKPSSSSSPATHSTSKKNSEFPTTTSSTQYYSSSRRR